MTLLDPLRTLFDEDDARIYGHICRYDHAVRIGVETDITRDYDTHYGHTLSLEGTEIVSAIVSPCDQSDTTLLYAYFIIPGERSELLPELTEFDNPIEPDTTRTGIIRILADKRAASATIFVTPQTMAAVARSLSINTRPLLVIRASIPLDPHAEDATWLITGYTIVEDTP